VHLPPPVFLLALTQNEVVAAAAGAAALLAALVTAVVLLRRRRARRQAASAKAPPSSRSRGAEAPALEVPPATARPAPRREKPAPPPPTPSLTPEEREAEEERKREAYRARKEAERLDRERKAREREEAEARERALAEARAREEAEARRAAEEEARRKAEAEAGRTLSAGLEKTRGGFMARLNALFTGGRTLDDSVLADLEEVLFTADIGVRTATRLLESARERVRRRELSDPARLKAALREEIARILELGGAGPAGPAALTGHPRVIMVVGVNGSGKTTTVGKLAAQLGRAGQTVLLGAGDTFRAAAGEQLEIWAERVGAPIVRGKEGGDPAAVCFEAIQEGARQGVDVVLCDTAGRLHTKAPLMEELKKVKRVMGKAAEGAPHEVLLVLDATNGQNAIAQARQFHEALGVTGIALTKLDGTAKGGVVIGICDELGIPVRYVGVGEKVADLRPFSPAEFVEALFQ
jgi:fused signal recognition particle receptor